MHNMEKKIADDSMVARRSSIEEYLTRMDPVMPVPNHGWRCFPANRHRNTVKQNLDTFWAWQRIEIENFTGLHGRSNHLPLARIKKVMKSDPKVKMVSSDAPIILAKACEIFIMELTLRAWMHAQSSSRQTVQVCDIADAVRNSELHDFLVDLVPPKVPPVSHQTFVPERALDQQLFAPAPANVNVPGTIAPIDMDQIQQQNQENLLADHFIDIGDFELDPNIH